MLEITMLPAREGDALWIRWGNPDHPRQMIVDTGTKDTGRKIKNLILSLPENQRQFDLVVITHIDSDHIWGAISCFVEQPSIPGLVIADFWFNGQKHIFESCHNLESLGPIQGDQLSDWLEQSNHWNLAFDKKSVTASLDSPPARICFPENMFITVLGPFKKRLKELAPAWPASMLKIFNEPPLPPVQLEGLGIKNRLNAYKLEDLKKVADLISIPDTSPTNASSITLILEHEGKRILLAADALADDLIHAIKNLESQLPAHFDAVKLPHHGSARNISSELISNIACKNWLVSTDGNRHHHPDCAAIARTIFGSESPSIHFNVSSSHNDSWSRKSWQTKLNYEAFYGNSADGLTVKIS
jgi:metal-dependent hydrolase (beta-lactamase superfamily II)